MIDTVNSDKVNVKVGWLGAKDLQVASSDAGPPSQDKFSRPNGRLLPIVYHPFLESLCIGGQFGLSENNSSASYESSEFCWQLRGKPPTRHTSIGPTIAVFGFLSEKPI